jgi:hypothetical protein
LAERALLLFVDPLGVDQNAVLDYIEQGIKECAFLVFYAEKINRVLFCGRNIFRQKLI